MTSDKTYTKTINLLIIRKKYGKYPQCDLVTCRQKISKKAKFNETLLFEMKKF